MRTFNPTEPRTSARAICGRESTVRPHPTSVSFATAVSCATAVSAVAENSTAYRTMAQGSFPFRAIAQAEACGSGRRGSVLVLVMTILAMLFVMGVAFLATMNFEAERLAAEARQRRTGAGSELVSADAGTFIAAGLMSNSEQPFSAAPAGAALASFSTLPGWHNITSPLEPAPVVLPFSGGRVVWPWHVDAGAMSEPLGMCVVGTNAPQPGISCTQDNDCFSNQRCRPLHLCEGGLNPGKACNPDGNVIAQCGSDSLCQPAPFGGPTWRGAAINPNWENGSIHGFFICDAGSRTGQWCEVNGDCPLPTGGNGLCVPLRGICSNNLRHCVYDDDCPGSGICQATPVTVVDADGDGIVDSLLTEASRLGYTPEQIGQLSAAVNPASNPDGNVYVALRIVPHGGMVNLNDAHPRLIEAAFDIPDIFMAYNINVGNYFYRPAQEQVFYSSLQEEPALRRRNIFPPRTIPPSRLHGDPNVAGMGTGILSDRNVWGDFPEHLFPPRAGQAGIFEHAINGTHRYWPTRPSETITPDSPPLWQVRMEPITAITAGLGDHYDRRHLVTTASHDDLLSRGGAVRMNGRTLDIREAMMRVNEAFNHPLCDGTLPFEYANYPRDLANNDRSDDERCYCDALGNCVFDRRKGRLKLSLAWLDQAIDRWKQRDTETGLSGQRLQRLVYDSFYMMLLNASGPAWDDHVCTTDEDCLAEGESAPGREFCGTHLQSPVCIDRVLRLPRRDAKITRTAASLTANLLDYMDVGACLLGPNDGLPCRSNADCPSGSCPQDDMPTRVAVRYLTFDGGICRPTVPNAPLSPSDGAFCREDMDCRNNPTDPYFCATFGDNDAIRTCEGGADHGKWCTIPSDCQSNPQRPGSCVSILGREINIAPEPRNGRGFEFAFGIENQPYITEVATVTDTEGNLTGWAIELFNPTDVDINTDGVYSLVVVDEAGAQQRIFLDNLNSRTIATNGGFMVITNSKAEFEDELDSLSGTVLVEHSAPGAFEVRNGSTILLVRRASYSNPQDPNLILDHDIVVDQFEVAGKNIGAENPDDRDEGSRLFVRLQRVLAPNNPAPDWRSVVPYVGGEHLFSIDGQTVDWPGTLGTWNTDTFPEPLHFMVEIRLPNTGSFTRVNPAMSNNPDRRNEVAFPTTGSMLPLMRHSNRSLGFFGIETAKTHRHHLAFTASLNEEIVVSDPNTGGQLATIREREQIDNGRMPLFDRGTEGSGNRTYAAHHVPPWQSPLGRPGGIENLPWGQLVFDYFTVLPLSNPGPYRVSNPDLVARDDAQPRVDQRGLRVHGRIDLNAAPWTVLSGLPFIPMEKIPIALRPRFQEELFGTEAPQQFVARALFHLGPENDKDGLARAIVAYREMREGFSEPIPGRDVGEATGDYSLAGFGRGWFDQNPAFRRGTGFLTVGELANLRHQGAAFGYYRIEGGLVEEDPDDASGVNYLDAIAVLASLGDWVTVRSQVFTVYGVIRGEADANFGGEEAEQLVSFNERRNESVDARAIRFQETVDRLPVFLGETAPRRIGDRTLAKFKDTTSD
jgi:hypothetical protein